MDLLIQPLDRRIAVAPGANLLDVLRAHQIPVSYSCMAGRCGTCRCRVLDGDVLDSGFDGERGQPPHDDFVLACQTFITAACTIEIPEPDEVVVHPARILKATVEAIDDLTHDIKRLRLRTPRPLDYSPGQFVQLQFTPEHVRPYSMARLAADGRLEFHVRMVPQGRVTGYIGHTLKAGDAVRVTGPMGTAYLRRQHTGPMLCVAGGTGLAPILAIVRGAIAAGMPNPIHAYVGARSDRDVYALDELAGLSAAHPALRTHIVVSSAGPAPHRRGLVTEAIARDWPSLTGWKAYLCGAPPMIDAVSGLIRQRGVAADDICADAFYSSTP